ncbi:MAG: hypothetical protein V5A42_05030, partial [Halofilum sp. (in: g-proteobacteria)]
MYRTLAVSGTAVAIALLLPFSAHGQEGRVAPVTVTATRTAQTADETLSSVTVIDREQIQESQAQSLPDLLSDQHGLSLS